MKTFPEKYLIADFYKKGRNAVLLVTSRFKVIIPRDHQTVPGVLKLEPQSKRLYDWDQWNDSDWKELIQVQRLLEFTLISAFNPRDPFLKPTQDDQLINFFGKQRNINGFLRIYFDIALRYSKPVIIDFDKEKTIFIDEKFGKPFDFSCKKIITDQVYQHIVNTLRQTLTITRFDQFQLNDHFEEKIIGCYNCQHPQNYPEQAGLVQVVQPKSQLTFSLGLDPRSQEEKGRGFCGSDLHIPALRYWEDERMVIVGKIFKHL